MGNENRSGIEGCVGSERTSSLDCDVGLGLKMPHTESNPCKKMTAITHHRSPESSFGGDYGGYCSRDGGPVYSNTINSYSYNNNNNNSNSNQMGCGSGIYDAVGAPSSVSGGAVLLPRTLQPFNTDTCFKSSGGGMPVSGKVLFTASQWQELERQTMIYKYMVASIPIPSQLLLPITKSQSHVSVPQSNTGALDLRFSSGSDPEPWRCRRTDGKKWRCSRDVAPDQKYCERHAHKTRPRSRKPVENQSHNNTTAPPKISDYIPQPPISILPPYTNTTSTDPFQKPTSQFQNMPSSTSYDQTRCIEWFMKGSTSIPESTSSQQWQQLMQSPSRVGTKRDSMDHSKNDPFFQQHYGEEQNGPMSLNNPYMVENQQLNDCSLLNHKLACLQGDDTTHTTRHFIDAWSTADREDVSAISNKCSVSSARKLPLSSLTLSMSGGNGIDEDSENAQLKSQWVSSASWMSSPPGGPLGEALCLGMAGNVKGASNVASSLGHSNSTTTSSCSKSSCEDAGQGTNFH